MKKVIITGANGFVGSHVVRELYGQGVEVIAVVRSGKSNIDRIKDIPGLKIYQCEMSQYTELPNIIKEGNADVLYHFAWEGSAGPARSDAVLQLGNIEHTCNLLNSCKKMDVKRFVLASSIMEYEVRASMDSDMALGTNSLYCSAKLAAGFMCKAIANSLGIDYIRGIISNIYGPGEVSPRLINTSLRKLLAGEHCSFSTGEQMYDFIYCTDAAKAFAAIGDKGINNKAYYIGSLNPKPLKEYLIEMKNCVNPDLEIGLGEIPFTGKSLTYQEFDINAVKNDTGFVPEISFAEGISRTIKWLREIN